ncbi:hypothetical protein NDU88_004589 [Pleurodeles waltl]|uniref:Uncharacterized protein n=1 Tax=Pleurodeles waltl TaxID=8319 RepID=A0AAV7L0C0_PLEWA|nr:hypothetical protein NDU88_004589 [Pleurodeles waltl]
MRREPQHPRRPPRACTSLSVPRGRQTICVLPVSAEGTQGARPRPRVSNLLPGRRPLLCLPGPCAPVLMRVCLPTPALNQPVTDYATERAHSQATLTKYGCYLAMLTYCVDSKLVQIPRQRSYSARTAGSCEFLAVGSFRIVYP